MSEITSQNIYGDPANFNVRWVVLHDDEIWVDDETDPGVWIASCGSALDAQYIVTLHNQSLHARQHGMGDVIIAHKIEPAEIKIIYAVEDGESHEDR